MAYTALYRKFRPTNFDDVKGQEHIVTTLRNQVKFNRIGHAYLFCGTRGTGKTSVAKLLAKVVNCEHPIDGNPCNTCEMCKAINNQTSMNVIEIDAASNNGVDNIRDIIDEVQYSPTQGRFKVYIIDEVHMLSAGAYNALLKTLEEPPSYVIFILATTEVHKIPVTILSRCQRYDFRRITIDTITERLQEILEKEQVEAEDKAVRYIAKSADGAFRDALSLLDQCIAFYFGEKLTYDKVLNVLGAVDMQVFTELFQMICNNDVTGCMELIERLIISGRELSQFVIDFTWYLRNLLLLMTSDSAEDIIDVTSENLVELKDMAKSTTADDLMRYIRIFSDLSNQVKYSTQKRVLVEIAVIKLCKPQMEQNYEAIIARLNAVEKQLQNGIVVADNQTHNKALPVEEKEEEWSKEKLDTLEAALPDDIKLVASNWKAIVNSLEFSTKAILKDVRLKLAGNEILQLCFVDDVEKKAIEKEEKMLQIEEAIAKSIGKKVKIQTRLIDRTNKHEDGIVDIQALCEKKGVEFQCTD